MTRCSAALRSTVVLLLAEAALCQVPDGWLVWCSFQGSTGQNGVFFSHPRDPAEPIVEVANLPAALAYSPLGRRGGATIVRRPGDGALLCGERAPAGTSVDLHVLTLSGASVAWAQTFSVGTSANVGEIPQCALLPDGRIVLAATDLTAGSPLAQFQTLQYNWEGVGILDPESGGVTPIAIANLNQFPGVINSLAVDAAGTTVYIGNYVSATAGDLWSVPVTGGLAIQVATLPAGASNLAIDNDGTVLVTTLNGPPNLFRYDPVANTTTPVPTTSGPLNAIGIERVTGNLVLATANAGVPVRSLIWRTPAGVETVLLSPNRATISGVDVNPTPEAIAPGTPSGAGSYSFALAPNPGGLPEAGNGGFSLTLETSAPHVAVSLFLLGTARAMPPLPVEGVDVHVDPSAAASLVFNLNGSSAVLALPIPATASLRGLTLFGQTLHFEVFGNSLGASPGLEITIL
jgi:hypothetical protein